MRFPWLQVDTDFLAAHSRDFASLLGVSRREAIGIAVDLWTWVLGRSTGEAPPDGLVEGSSAARLIAGAVEWSGEAAALLEALEGAGLAVVLPEGVRVLGMSRYKATWEKNKRRCAPVLPTEQIDEAWPARCLDAPLVRLKTPEERAQWDREEAARAAVRRAAAEERRRLKALRWVYFMQDASNPAAPIKIGISKDVERRRCELQRVEQVRLAVLATFQGTMSDEASMHARFGPHRLHGEWFSPAPELLSHIAVLNGVKR